MIRGIKLFFEVQILFLESKFKIVCKQCVLRVGQNLEHQFVAINIPLQVFHRAESK